MAMLVPGYAARVLVSTWPGTGPGTRPDTETDVHPSLGNFPSTRFATQRQCSVTLSDRSYHVIYRDWVSTINSFLLLLPGKKHNQDLNDKTSVWRLRRYTDCPTTGKSSFVGNQSYICIYLDLQCACSASICNPLIYWLAPGCCWHGHHSGLRVRNGNQYSVITRM